MENSGVLGRKNANRLSGRTPGWEALRRLRIQSKIEALCGVRFFHMGARISLSAARIGCPGGGRLRRAWDFIRLFGTLALVFLMMVWPGEALSAAQGAMRAWAQSVGPSLFPFLALLPALTCQEAQCFYKRLLGRLMRPLFRLPGNAAAALFVGLLAGSPAGALAVERVSGGMRRGEAKRLGLMCAGVSPVYLISGVGAALFGSVELGLWLAAAQAAAQIMLGLALRGRFAAETQLLPQAPDREGQPSVRAAVASVLQVCGYMALFSVGAAMVAKLAGGMAGDYLLYIADMPSGLARAAERGASWPLAAAVAGFGGLCIATQNMAVLGALGVRWWEYLAARSFVAGICALTIGLRFSLPGAAAPAMATFKAGALETSTLGAMLLLIPALLAVSRGAGEERYENDGNLNKGKKGLYTGKNSHEKA